LLEKADVIAHSEVVGDQSALNVSTWMWRAFRLPGGWRYATIEPELTVTFLHPIA
jgi:hypothetical protein